MVPSVLPDAWERQSIWSQTADNIKAGVTRARTIVLAFSIAGALLSTGAAVAGLEEPAGKALGACAALAVGLAGVARSRTAPRAVQDWTRARSASEGIKAEVYSYLTRVADYAGGDRERRLDEQVAGIEDDVHDLLGHTHGVTPRERATPTIDDIASYASDRVQNQITRYYRNEAGKLKTKVDTVRRAEIGLAVVGVVLAVLASSLELDDVAVWIPVVTTVATAITAHAAAERYELLRVEYLRTASELERLLKRWERGDLADEAFVRSCEDVISSQNERWMAKLGSEEDDSARG